MENKSKAPQAAYFKGKEFKKNVDIAQWYVKDFTVEGPARQVFEEYSGIPSDKVVQHVSEVRDRAWENMPYACIGSLRFLNFSLSQNPNYGSIISRLTSPGSSETMLDLGCCFGHDIRKLILDGAPASHLYGIDIDPAFIELGYDLFLDRESLKSTFTTADMFLPPSKELISLLGGGVDIIYAASFFNLFNWEQEIHLAKNIIKLMKPVKGSMILGRQLGSAKAGEYPHLKKDGTTTYWHDVDSWKRLWKEVGDATNSAWTVDASLDEKDYGFKENQWGDENMRRLLFAVYRQ